MLLYIVVWLLTLLGVTFAFLYAPTPLGIGISVLIVIFEESLTCKQPRPEGPCSITGSTNASTA